MLRTYLGLFIRAAISTFVLIAVAGSYLEYVGAQWIYEEDVQITRGYLRLMDKEFATGRYSKQEFEQYYSELLGFSVHIVAQSVVDDIVLLHQERGVSVDVDEDLFYWPLSSDDENAPLRWLEIEPLGDAGEGGDYFVLFIIALICAVSMFLWCWPLMRRLARLKQQVDAFAVGQLDARVKDNKKDEVNKIMMAFNTMAAQLSASMDKQHTVNQAFSHEIRTPLSRIKMLVHGLPAEKKSSLLEEVDEIDFLISEILSYNDVKAVNSKTQQHWFDIAPWAEQCFAVWAVPEDVSYVFQLDDSCGGRQLWGQESQLELVVGNLLLNALRHADRKVCMKIQSSDDGCSIIVEDDGEGVPEPLQEKIFEPFFRVDSSRSRETGGSGMGLAIAAKISAYHNATLSCDDSEDLAGARFTLSIPLR